MGKLVYVGDRSVKLPRRKRRRFVPKNNSTVIAAPYRAADNSEIASVLERRCESGRWLTKQQDEDKLAADAILDEMIYG